MAVRLKNIPGLSEPPGYSHLGSALARVSCSQRDKCLGQSGELVGAGDYRAQTEQVLRNLLSALASGSARPEDVIKTTVYVVGASHETQNIVWSEVRDSPVGAAPSTLVGVALLGYQGQLVEIDAIAIVEEAFI